ncbi:MAG: HEAT repeat domain-containing protein [Planctomycetota bacterium]|jgi:HEAT repeat protein
MRALPWILIPCVLLSAPAFAGGKPFSEENRWATERRLVAELSLIRREKGLPPLLWCERMALPMRLHLEALLEAGYRGEGAAPARVGRVTMRASKYHGWTGGEIFANYGTAREGEYDPREQVERMFGNPDVKRSYTDPVQNIGAAVLRVMKGGKVFVYLAVAKVETGDVKKEFDRAASFAFRIASGNAGLSEEGLSALETFPAFEGAPLYLDLLRGKDAARRASAVRALGALADPASIPPLLAHLSDKDASVREAALECLRAMTGLKDRGPEPRGWETWWEASRDEFKPVGRWEPPPPPPPVPPEGAEGEGEKPAPEPERKEPEPLEAKTLGRHVRSALSGKTSPVLRLYCARALGLAMDSKTASNLLPVLEAAHFPVRLQAAEALVRRPHKSLLSKLTGALRKRADDPPVLRLLYKAIGRTGEKRAVKVLAQGATREPNLAVACACARGLSGVREKSAVSALIKILADAEARGKDALASATRSSLAVLTRASPGKTAAQWAAWWAKNRGRFSFPD